MKWAWVLTFGNSMNFKLHIPDSSCSSLSTHRLPIAICRLLFPRLGWLLPFVKRSGIAIFIGILCLLPLDSKSQYPQHYFRSPLDIPLNLSGNFGELRTNHFHSGIDIKTEQREGLSVYAVAEGYVSRIKVSPFGYGYALYITHPNGYTTLYGHLKSYSDKIRKYVKAEQYRMESFSVDLFPAAYVLPVVKGEVIGFSGNTGGSGGPHLHFEIRETETEKLINPLLFGFDVKDKISPSITGIWLAPLNDSSWVSGVQSIKNFSTKIHSGKSSLVETNPIGVYGDIGMAIHTSDALDGNSNRCGVYRIELLVDSIMVFAQTFDQLDFATNRAMNAHTIYEKFKKDRSSIHRSYRLENNPLDIYDNLLNDGILSFRDGHRHIVIYIVTDFKGNKSTLRFMIQSQKPTATKPNIESPPLAYFDFENENVLDMGEVKIAIDAYSLYEDLEFNMTKQTKMANAISPTFIIASPYVPLHSGYQLSINTGALSDRVKNKALIVRWDQDKDRIYPELSTYENGWITASPQYFGYFGVMVDTIAPSLSSIDFAANLKGRTMFSFRIKDGLSDIHEIIPRIDGKWALMEYDPKNSRINYYFDPEYIQHGKHSFELIIRDERKNETKYQGGFEW